jgi:hypothetical protein
MFPAARIGDPITHDQTVPSGMIGPPMPGRLPTVIIEGLLAAVVGDFVTCTGVISVGIVHPPQAGPPPSTPPPFQLSRAVDTAACGVFLGDSKLVAIRTVLIGG